MDQGSGASSLHPASVAVSAQPIVKKTQTSATTTQIAAAAFVSARARNSDYRVADLFGRCFLRVCYWVEVFSSMARRGEPLPYSSPFQDTAKPLTALEAAKQMVEQETAATLDATPQGMASA
jgi:hypothetical protein